MKIISTLFLFLLFGLAASPAPTPAQAHELKTYSSISVLLHINPDDDPIAGQPSELLFLTADKEKKFKTEDCDCYASVIYNNEVLFSSPLLKASSSYRGIFAPAIPYTFPQKGVYTVRLVGVPKNNSFQGFDISYDIRIDKDATTKTNRKQKDIFYYFIVIGIVAGTVYAIKLFFSKKIAEIDNLK